MPLAVACLLPLAVCADNEMSVDARFDKTGDGIVDASDWELMQESDKADYAWASVDALGQDPYVQLPGGKSRAQAYLDGLRAVYE